MNGLLLLTLCSLGFMSGLASECTSANEGQEVFDSCGRACFCEKGQLVDCCRIRKDFTSMTPTERARYISTIKTARTDARYRKDYRRIIIEHSRLFREGIHTKSEFLPWHRYYMLEWEDLLEKIDCRVALPYYDWSLFSGRPWEETRSWAGRPDDLNEGFWSPSPRGFGGDGGGDCVQTGEFTKGKWKIPKKKECITRSFRGNPAGIVTVHTLLRKPHTEFDNFELELRVELHNGFHCNVGGTMCGLDSASAPEFFLHHGFIDKLWANWQEIGEDYMNAYFVENNARLTLTRRPRRLGEPRRPRYYAKNFVDTTKIERQGKPSQCVLYEDPQHPEYRPIIDHLNNIATSELNDIERHSFTPPTNRDLKKLDVSEKDRERAAELVGELQPAQPLKTEKGMDAEEKALGFKIESLNKRSITGKRMAPVKQNGMWERWRKRHEKSPAPLPQQFHANATFS